MTYLCGNVQYLSNRKIDVIMTELMKCSDLGEQIKYVRKNNTTI